MKTKLTITKEGEILTLSVANASEDEFTWRYDSNQQSHIYFEYSYDGQKNSGYDLVQECTVMFDGLHLVLTSGVILHFYFNHFLRTEYKNLCATLALIHVGTPGVLEIIDK